MEIGEIIKDELDYWQNKYYAEHEQNKQLKRKMKEMSLKFRTAMLRDFQYFKELEEEFEIYDKFNEK